MVNLALSWQQAGVLAGALLGAGALAARSGRPRPRTLAPFVREIGIVAGLYALWQLAGSASPFGTAGAVGRGEWILRTEHTWQLPDEADLQRLILPHPLLAQACNLYYASMHFAALFALLLWLFIRHRDRYPQVRTTVVLVTAACLLIEFMPVAPPRLLPNGGFVDVAERYGQSVYVALKAVGPDQLSAMPSVHVAWAFLVAVAVITSTSSRWRWWVIVHPVLTVFVVVATANHYWADGIVAVILLALSLLVQRAARGLRARHAQRGAGPVTTTDQELAAAP